MANTLTALATTISNVRRVVAVDPASGMLTLADSATGVLSTVPALNLVLAPQGVEFGDLYVPAMPGTGEAAVVKAAVAALFFSGPA